MDNLQDIELRLWDYIDGTSNEKVVVKKLIEENTAWRQKYAELLEVDALMNTIELEQPSMRFTKNVMEEVGKTNIALATKNYINPKIIWSIAIFFITVISAVVLYGIGQIDWTTRNDNTVSIIDLSTIDYTVIFNNTFVNIFMMVNVVLGLMFLDRYLSSKKRKQHKEA